MLNVTKALNKGYETILKKPKIYLLSLAAIFLILIIAYAFGGGLYITGVMEITPKISETFIIFFIILLVFLVGIWFNISLIKLAYDRKSDIKEALIFSIKKFVPYILASIIVGLIMISIVGIIMLLSLLVFFIFFFIFGFTSKLIFGIILLIFLIPAIYIQLRLMFYGYAIIIDNESIFSSLEKSWNITKNNVLRLFLLLILIILISLGILGISYLFSFTHITIQFIITCLLEAFLLAFYTTTLVSAYLQLSRSK